MRRTASDVTRATGPRATLNVSYVQPRVWAVFVCYRRVYEQEPRNGQEQHSIRALCDWVILVMSRTGTDRGMHAVLTHGLALPQRHSRLTHESMEQVFRYVWRTRVDGIGHIQVQLQTMMGHVHVYSAITADT